MWDQSLMFRFLTVLVATTGNSGLAITHCSNSFRFDQLCPDPRFGSREGGAIPGSVGSGMINNNNLLTDTSIKLNTDSSSYQTGRAVSGTYAHSSLPSSSYGGRSYASPTSVKDPTTTSCDFHRNGVETAVVTAIHVTENPWHFRHANQCNHIVKLSYDLFESGTSPGSGVGWTGGGYGTTRQSVCQKEIGFRIQGSHDVDHRQIEKDKEQVDQGHNHHHTLGEELLRKMNVYFWHNFTIYSHSAEFVDTIINYHWSKEDISCVSDQRNAQYVQIAAVVYKGGRCEVIVQQYEIVKKRSPWGCSGTNYSIPYPIQFCGTYDCSQSTSILNSLKLLRRRDSDGYETEYSGYPCTTDMPMPSQTSESPSQPTSGSQDSSEAEEEKGTKEIDWYEILFLAGFPCGGVLFTLVVLNILRTRNARDICLGYNYPRVRQHDLQHGMYLGSFNSIDKHGLPI